MAGHEGVSSFAGKVFLADGPPVSSEPPNWVGRLLKHCLQCGHSHVAGGLLCPAGTISVCYNGSIGEAFYQDEPYWATDDVNVLAPRFTLTPSIAIFIATVIKNESVKYAFNNKWTKELMEKSEIILPAKSDGTPDFDFMEHYIQSLPYSRFF